LVADGAKPLSTFGLGWKGGVGERKVVVNIKVVVVCVNMNMCSREIVI
jgi:hypothetical protein